MHCTNAIRNGIPDAHTCAALQLCLPTDELRSHLRNLALLANAKVKHDLLGPARNGHGSNLAREALDFGALPATRVSQSPEDLRTLTRAILKHLRALNLQQCSGAAELHERLQLLHGVHLVGDDLQPGVVGLDLTRHLCEFPSDDRVVNELLAEGLALICELQAFLETNAGEAVGHPADEEALVVEILHDVLEPFPLFTDQVRCRNLHVAEGDEGGA